MTIPRPIWGRVGRAIALTDTMGRRCHTGRYTIFSSNLEQVHVRSMFSRGLRLELVATLGVALAIPATAVSAESARGIATQTTMTAETHDRGGHSETTLTIFVNGEDGLPA